MRRRDAPATTAVKGVWKIMGNVGGLHAFVSGSICNRQVRILCDTGAFCNCMSLSYFDKHLSRMTFLNPFTGPQNLTSANNSVLSVAGTVKLNIQVAQLSQRDRAAGWVSNGQKWKTGTERQYLRTI